MTNVRLAGATESAPPNAERVLCLRAVWPGQVGHRHIDPIDDPVRGFDRVGEPFGWFTARVEDPGDLLEVVAVAAQLGSRRERRAPSVSVSCPIGVEGAVRGSRRGHSGVSSGR